MLFFRIAVSQILLCLSLCSRIVLGDNRKSFCEEAVVIEISRKTKIHLLEWDFAKFCEDF